MNYIRNVLFILMPAITHINLDTTLLFETFHMVCKSYHKIPSQCTGAGDFKIIELR